MHKHHACWSVYGDAVVLHELSFVPFHRAPNRARNWGVLRKKTAFNDRFFGRCVASFDEAFVILHLFLDVINFHDCSCNDG